MGVNESVSGCVFYMLAQHLSEGVGGCLYWYRDGVIK